jgi:hypothetical protein
MSEAHPKFRRGVAKTLLQILVGLALCFAVAYVLIYHSNVPLLWEHEEPLDPGVYSLTWRSGAVLVLLMVVTQTASFLIFCRTRLGRTWR